MKAYVKRRLEPTLLRCVRRFPCTILTGPRQSGKTTLVRHCLDHSHRYVSLDEPDVRTLARRDPRLFLDTHHPPVILDEIQYAPELLPYIKRRVDERRENAGQYVLTGSQMFPLMAGVSESLAGRTAVLVLLPLSWGERCRRPVRSSPVASRIASALSHLDVHAVGRGLLRGGFPEPALAARADVRRWYGGYVQTYLERDVRQLRHVGDLEEFHRFLRALAARHGQILNMAEMARDLGLALNTVKAWVSVLVAGHQIVLVRPYYRNLGKRLVKAPKVYFLDSGLVGYFTGLQTTEQWLHGPLAGALLEAEVVSEIVKWFCNRGEQPVLYSWRTAAGAEVDCVLEHAGAIWPIEVKLGAMAKAEYASGLTEFMRLFPEAKRGRVIYLGREIQPLARAVEAVPFSWLQTW